MQLRSDLQNLQLRSVGLVSTPPFVGSHLRSGLCLLEVIHYQRSRTNKETFFPLYGLMFHGALVNLIS
ncbi:hypothetical protein QN277_000702 [Acacia crassicarpa]|uniref:Uncharacterized protein n=1 Tax=Acacia crassicarpa TaxID=499986 RepID=A0AAE1N5K4_9FABA|nr:hypothetical protein QN277_000702 [Acacia crassicarpa]